MQMFKVNGIEYKTNEKGNYFYKLVGEKWERIGKDEYEMAFDAYVDGATEDAMDGSVDPDLEQIEAEQKEAEEEAKKEFGENSEDWDTEDEIKERREKEAEADRQTEETFNKEKKTKKPRKSKDIAHESDGITLTAKQVDFIKHMPDTSFYENGLESTMWCDVLADEIGGQFAGKPMTVGAMISTLREKSLIYVDQDRINGRKCKYFGFTETGKKIAKELGLH